MKITRVHVEGFRSLRDVTFEAGTKPVTVLIGPNGAGKSNLMGCLGFASTIWRHSMRAYVGRAGGASRVLHRGRTPADRIRLEIGWEDGGVDLTYRARLERTAADELFFADESVLREPKEGVSGLTSLGTGHAESRLVTKPGWDQVGIPRGSSALKVISAFRSMRAFHFHDTSPNSPLRTNARAIEHRELAFDGSNLASYLLWLRQAPDPSHQASWKLLSGAIRLVAPLVAELVPTPVNADPETFRFDDPNGNIDKVTIRLDWTDDQGTRFGVSDLSDGTLRIIALFAALTQPGTALPAFICVDEPELGLHPAAITVLVGLIRSVSHRCQVLLATQSPALLDHFSPDEVVVAERVDGATQLRRLDSEALESWLEDYSLSELYDKNVLGGRP